MGTGQHCFWTNQLDNQPTSHGAVTMSLKSSITILALVPGWAWASDACTLQDRTVNESSVVIEQRSLIDTSVVMDAQGQHQCHVSFSVRIRDQWYLASSSYSWNGDSSREQACAVAVYKAEEQVRAQVGETRVRNEKVLVCQDAVRTLPAVSVGQTAKLEQFRPHPEFLDDFFHAGTRCRWILDTVFQDQRVHTYQGIICQTSGNTWTVVDKF